MKTIEIEKDFISAEQAEEIINKNKEEILSKIYMGSQGQASQVAPGLDPAYNCNCCHT